MFRVPLRLACLLLLAAFSGLRAQTTFIWTGATSGDFNTAANWRVDDGDEGVPTAVIPPAESELSFRPGFRSNVTLSGPTTVGSLTIGKSEGASGPLYYAFGGTASLTIQGDQYGIGLRVQGLTKAAFAPSLTINVGGTQTWYLDTGTTTYVDGPIAGADTVVLTKDGSGVLHLRGQTSGLSGTMAVDGGTLALWTSTAFENAVVSVGSGGALASFASNGTTIGSAVSLESGAKLGSSESTPGPNKLVFTGAVTVGSSVVLAESSQSYFESTLNGSAANANVTFTGGGVAILKGTTAPTTPAASFTANGAGLVINTTEALPTGGLQALSDGYLGMGAAFASDPTAFIGKISDQSIFSGTLGFDSDPSGAPNVFGTGKTINLTGFASFRGLGSASHANLAANAVLNFSGDYQFGGGGGRLVVSSNLVDKNKIVEGMPVPVGLTVSSPATAPLTLVLTGTNTFIGDINVDHSYLIFDSTSGLPTDPTISLGESGYVSATSAASLTATALLGKITSSDSTSILGFDSSAPASDARTVSDAIALGTFSGYLGTTTFYGTGLTLSGQISGPDSKTLKLTGVNNGKLNVASPLLLANNITAVVVGHPDAELGNNGTVVLSGASDYTGGTTLQSGTLLLGSSSASDGSTGPLGKSTGDLTVANDDPSGMNSAVFLAPATSSISLLNDIVLEANAHLRIGRDAGNLTLGGNFSGAGALWFVGPTVTTLTGASTRDGDTYVQNATVNVAADTGLASTNLFVINSTVAFGSTASAPTIGSLSGTSGSVMSFGAANTTLTINQTLENNQVIENKYAGTFAPSGTLSLVKTGPMDLWLATPVSVADLTVNQGLIKIDGTGTHNASHAYLGNAAGQSGGVSVRGATWAVSTYLKVGAANGSNGHLIVDGGGQVTTPLLYIGYGESSDGQVQVSGAGSALTASTLTIGSGVASVGSLSITNGGSVTVNGAATLASSSAYLDIGDGSSVGSFSATGGLVNNGFLAFNNTTAAITFDTDITGAGHIGKAGAGALTLSGDNSGYSGEISVGEGSITFASNTAAGTGPLWLGNSVDPTTDAAAIFTTSAPVMGSLAGSTAGSTLTLADSSTLTIQQAEHGSFSGVIQGTTANTNNAALVVQGTGAATPVRLELSGANTYTGGTTITNGAILLAAHNNALGSAGTVTVSGATLATAADVTLAFTSAHPLALNNGRIGGVGTFSLTGASNSISISNGNVVAPGIAVPGNLTFNLNDSATLTFDSGGTYYWRLQDASEGGTTFSAITVVGTLAIAATGSPFNFSLATFDSGGASASASNFNATNTAHWTVLTATTITGFDSANFSIDATNFLNAPNGLFSLSQSGNSLVLNFTPVPEPSTWALLITGLAIVGVGAIRRRQRR